MTTPATVHPNLAKLRQVQEKTSKRKELFKRVPNIKRDAPNERLPIGDNNEVNNIAEIMHQDGKGSRPPTSGAVSKLKIPCKELLHPDSEHQHIDDNKIHPLSDMYKSGSLEGTSSSDAEDTLVTKTSPLVLKEYIEPPQYSSNKIHHSSWKPLLVWLFSFVTALTLYFLIFCYAYKQEPVYSKICTVLGIKEEVPLPPPTVKESILRLLSSMCDNCYNLYSSLLEKISFASLNNKRWK